MRTIKRLSCDSCYIDAVRSQVRKRLSDKAAEGIISSKRIKRRKRHRMNSIGDNNRRCPPQAFPLFAYKNFGRQFFSFSIQEFFPGPLANSRFLRGREPNWSSLSTLMIWG